jgi:hypothetical protein
VLGRLPRIGGSCRAHGLSRELGDLVARAAYLRDTKDIAYGEVARAAYLLVRLTPSGTALVVDTSDGKDKLSDEEIDHLFVARK